jgi:hypothetical protein
MVNGEVHNFFCSSHITYYLQSNKMKGGQIDEAYNMYERERERGGGRLELHPGYWSEN